MHSLWSSDHDSSKQKVKTIDIQTIAITSTLLKANFPKCLTDLFEKLYPVLLLNIYDGFSRKQLTALSIIKIIN